MSSRRKSKTNPLSMTDIPPLEKGQKLYKRQKGIICIQCSNPRAEQYGVPCQYCVSGNNRLKKNKGDDDEDEI